MRSLWAVVLMALVVLAGCAGGPKLRGPVDLENAGQEVDLGPYFAGEIKALAPGEGPGSAVEAFFVGESLVWAGDMEGAYEVFVGMLRDYPGHRLNRYAAFRLYEMRYEVVNFSERAARDLVEIHYDQEWVLTREMLARLSHHIKWQLWRRSDDAEPFGHLAGGVMHHWRATPRLSPYRLLDFDEVFGPEESEELDERYLSPQLAVDGPENWENRQLIYQEQPGERLELGRQGIYYLESRLDIAEGGKFTVSGHFPAATKVWVGSEEVLNYEEKELGSARLYREIELGEGRHRILIKIAYQPGVRDWFELYFVPHEGEIFADLGLRESLDGAGKPGVVQVRGPQLGAMELEPVVLKEEELAGVSSPSLYGAALSAYISGDSAGFDRIWSELEERHPEFAPAYLLASHQVRTRWELPAELRGPAAIAMLRRALELDPENLHGLVALERRLRNQSSDRELRQMLELAREQAFARDGTGLRQVAPLVNWALYLERKGWKVEAEEAWKAVLAVDESDCLAATRLQGLYWQRNYIPEPWSITKSWQSCEQMARRWLKAHPSRNQEWVDYAARDGKRYPFSAERQLEWAEALQAVNEHEDADFVLKSALERMPEALELWEARVDLALLEGDEERARALLDEAARLMGRLASLELRRITIDRKVPLQGLMHDGYQAAMAEIRKGDQESPEPGAMALDDAYFVIDFAAREYLPDGSTWTLTHMLVRVMTKGAIDRYGERTIPQGAELLLARTIKESGEVRVPEEVPGKSTLSMPGLAEGDFVEIAYLQFEEPGEIPSHLEGIQFYFQMNDISTRLSEYIVLGAEGLSLERANGAPEPEYFEWEGKKAIRLTARDRRHPRRELRPVGAVEYLPWVREYRIGVEGDVLDVERRYFTDTLLGSTKAAPELVEQVEEWLGRPLSKGALTDEEVKRLYYATADHFSSPSPGAIGTSAVHSLYHRRGSPLVVLQTALQLAGVESDIYLARQDDAYPERGEISEIQYFRQPLMRVEMPESGEVVWLEMGRRDGMFGALEANVVGQPGICISCEEFREEQVQLARERRPRRHMEVLGRLDETGELLGQITYRFEGARAVNVRAALRSRPDEADRRDYFERVLTGDFAGAELVGADIRGELERDRPLELILEFRRPHFARQVGDRLVVEGALLREAMEAIYAPLSTRSVPLFVGYEREQSADVQISLPEGFEAELRAQDVNLEEVAEFERRTWIEDGKLRLKTRIYLPRQRVLPQDYPAFREWARQVEESARVWLAIEL